VRKPKVFLFDEPLSNLDAKMRAATRAEIAKLHARLGATMIYVTHDQVEAMTMGDRICVMCDGHIMQVAEPLELYHRPGNRFVAGFIGSPPMNLFSGTVKEESQGTVFVGDGPGTPMVVPLGEGSRAAGLAGGPVVLGVRPEDVHDAAEPGWDRAGAGIVTDLDLAEPMGAETHLHLSAGGTALMARVRGDGRYGSDRRVRVVFDVSRAHVFDGTSGEAILHFQDAAEG
jgi:multiple sugar transport system ATP-binding protein